MNSTAVQSGQRDAIAAAVIGVSAITIVGKVCGFAEKMVAAAFFGTSESADTYFAVMALMWSAVYFAKELVLPTLLPVFRSVLQNDSELAGGVFRSVLFTVLVAFVIAAVSAVAAGRWIIAAALPGFQAEQNAAAARLLKSVSPGAVCLGLMVVTYTCLNARKRFVVSALGEALFKALLVVGLVVLAPRLRLDAVGFAVAAAALPALLFHLYFLPERRFVARPATGASSSRDLREIRRLMAPLILGVVFSHVSGLVDNLLASKLPTGQLSQLNYGKKLVDAIVLIGPVALVTVVYAQCAHHFAEGRMEEIRTLIFRSTRLLIFASLPTALLIICLRTPLVSMLFERGRFDAVSTAGTASALLVYALGLMTFALEGLFVYCFYAMRDTRTPVILGIVFVAVDIVLAVVLMARWEYLGIAAALVLSKTGKVLLLMWFLHSRARIDFLQNALAFALKTAGAVLALWLAVEISARAVGSLAPRAAEMAVVAFALPAAAGCTAFALAAYGLRIREAQEFVTMLKARLDRLRRRGSNKRD